MGHVFPQTYCCCVTEPEGTMAQESRHLTAHPPMVAGEGSKFLPLWNFLRAMLLLPGGGGLHLEALATLQ